MEKILPNYYRTMHMLDYWGYGADFPEQDENSLLISIENVAINCIRPWFCL